LFPELPIIRQHPPERISIVRRSTTRPPHLAVDDKARHS
jgi:hypothetical protein